MGTHTGEPANAEDRGHVSWHDAPEAFDRWLREGLEACGATLSSY